jgi:hypothetical protein
MIEKIYVSVFVCLMAGFVWWGFELSTSENVERARHIAWAAQHCKRTGYSHYEGVYTCDDGNVYLLRDMP